MGVVTYSPAFTIVPTYECFNRCDYCNFRQNPGQGWNLAGEEVRKSLALLHNQDVCEILILSGEVHPRSSDRPAWLTKIYQACQVALEMGFLPHTNVGPLSWAEMMALGSVNVSMGLMVEQVTPRWRETIHRYAPSKDPELRLNQLRQAGVLRIPFTTGILVGLGESVGDRHTSLREIAKIHRQYGHIQEVIIQPYQPGSGQVSSWAGCSMGELVETIAMARSLLPMDIAIQVPPNLLMQPQDLKAALRAGARDLGGIGPVDEVNPDYGHMTLAQMAAQLSREDFRLEKRLPVYPQYEDWLPISMQRAIAQWKQRA
ncbi:MAG: 7,8-didemethyl-8-hydroxy-5-deazariboflavin synthase subunit CofG [Cyanophyceae cyanobacterium]